MTIDVRWANSERTVARWDFPVVWTWEDFHEAKRQLDVMLDDVNRDCAVLLILPSGVKIPENVLSNMKRIVGFRHPHAVLNIIVSPSLFVRMLTDMGKKITHDMRDHFQVVDTLEKAHEILIATGYLTAEDRIVT